MKIDKSLQTQVEAAFAPLNNVAAARSFPPPTSLSNALEPLVPATSKTSNVTPKVAAMFTTASVDMWLRGVHSFLISASITGVSPIWASVAGYYSSHYSVRAIAHLLGFFQLFKRKRIVQLQLQAGRYVCTFKSKEGGQREHKFYWRVVKQDRHFAADPLFTKNDPASDDTDSPPSDLSHRDRANYADHLSQIPVFRPLDVEALKQRIEKIASIEFTTPPIPFVKNYPDVESVQVVAYHRLIRFRSLVDAILGGHNRFWSVYRSPDWATRVMNFQLTEQASMKSRFTLS